MAVPIIELNRLFREATHPAFGVPPWLRHSPYRYDILKSFVEDAASVPKTLLEQYLQVVRGSMVPWPHLGRGQRRQHLEVLITFWLIEWMRTIKQMSKWMLGKQVTTREEFDWHRALGLFLFPSLQRGKMINSARTTFSWLTAIMWGKSRCSWHEFPVCLGLSMLR